MGVVNIYPNERKVLESEVATSIVCSKILLEENSRLERIIVSRDNAYYRVGNSNACIMHVEQGLCILIDYKVSVYNLPGQVCSLPHLLSGSHYGVYQNKKRNNRDWVRNTASSQSIGYDIKQLIHGPGCNLAGEQLEHLSWTWDEREMFKIFGPNKERDSHRKNVVISTENELNRLIDKIVESDRTQNPINWKKK